MLIFYILLGFLVFFLQNFLPFTRIRLDIITLFIIFVSLRAKFIIAVSLALVLGTTLDCYGLAPLGLHAALLVLAVMGVHILRGQVNFLYVFPQIIGVVIIMMVQSLVMALLLHLLMPMPVIHPGLMQRGLEQIGFTALAAPIFLAIFGRLENLWRRWLLIKV